MEKASKCGTCGTAEWEWVEDPYAYSPVRYTCAGCRKREILLDDDDDAPKGTTVRLVDKATAIQIEMALHEQQKRRRLEQREEDGD